MIKPSNHPYTMKPIDKTFLDESRRHYEEILQCGTVTNCNLEAFIEVAKEYFDPNLRLDLTSAVDILEFIKWLYARYDEYLLDPEKILKPGQKVIGGMF